MAGQGPPPKAPGTRARRNRTSTAATIKADPSLRVPRLPQHPRADEGYDWHPMTAAMWKEAWHSPMAPEFVDADKHGMFVYALLIDDFWTVKSARQRAELAAEIRLSGQRFGFSPIDRRRLQWEVEKAEDAQQRGRRRRGEPAPAAEGNGSDLTDARAVLRAIK